MHGTHVAAPERHLSNFYLDLDLGWKPRTDGGLPGLNTSLFDARPASAGRRETIDGWAVLRARRHSNLDF